MILGHPWHGVDTQMLLTPSVLLVPPPYKNNQVFVLRVRGGTIHHLYYGILVAMRPERMDCRALLRPPLIVSGSDRKSDWN